MKRARSKKKTTTKRKDIERQTLSTNKKGAVLLLLSTSLFLFLCLFRVVYMDMFFDGLIYASIARNMAQGIGSFWYPYYTKFFLNPFYEHPPLVFWLQSFAYKIFGDHRLVEYLWGTVCAALIIFFIYRIYLLSDQKKTSEGKVLSTSWFPIFLFALIPTVSWTFSNNLLENTMAVFTTCSVWLMFRAFVSTSATKLVNTTDKNIFVSYFAAGLLIVMAFLSKGLVGLFPLAVPVILIIAYKKLKTKEIKRYLLTPYIALFSSIFLVGLFFYLFKRQESASYFFYYFNNQVVKSLLGQNENVRHLYLVYRFLGELIIPIAIATVLYIVLRWSKKLLKPTKLDSKFFVAMLLIAASASFPTFITPKQRAWYLFASWPFYSLAIAYYFRNSALSINKIFEKKLFKKVALTISIFLLATSIILVLFCSGTKFQRMPSFYDDLISQKVSLTEEQVVVSVCPALMAQAWEKLAFAQRYYKASFTPDEGSEFLLYDVENQSCSIVPKNCIPMNSNPKKFALYKCTSVKEADIKTGAQ